MSKERLKEFEDTLKEFILFRFQKNLPETSVILLKNNEYVDENSIDNGKDENDVKSDLIRRIIYDLINVTCELDYEVSEGEFKKILYGEALESGLIEYYSLGIAKNQNVDFKMDPECKDDLTMVLELYKVLLDELDYMAFNNDAIEILEKSNSESIIDYFDKKALSASKKVNEVKETTSSAKEEKEEDVIKSNDDKQTSDKGTFQIIYLNGKKTIKYVDEFNNVHLIEANDDYALREAYRKAFSYNKNSENVDPKIVFDELVQKFGEESLDTSLDERTITADKIRTTDFVGNDKFKEKVQDKDIKFDKDAETFVLPETNEVLEAHIEEDKVNASINHDSGQTSDEMQTVFDIGHESETELSKDQIDTLKKRAEESKLTVDELKQLRRALSIEATNDGNQELADKYDLMNTMDLEILNDELQKKKSEQNEVKEETSGFQLKKKKAAYIDKSLLFFIFCIILSLSMIIGVILAYYSS